MSRADDDLAEYKSSQDLFYLLGKAGSYDFHPRMDSGLIKLGLWLAALLLIRSE